jgi:SSS family solute:Na+ symporter
MVSPPLAAVAYRFHLDWLDAAVVGVPILLVLGVAWFMKQYVKNVADYLAASRTAGRYLIAVASYEAGAASVVAFVQGLETFSRAGWSLNLWYTFSGFIFTVLALVGFVTYRFRETRALTFHQFFELRYSRGVRVLATFLNVFSGIITFSVGPAVGARFFVYFAGIPDAFPVGPWTVPTYVPLMVLFIGVALWFTVSGGHLSVMVTDCLEGLISGVMYLAIAFTIWFMFTRAQMGEAIMSGPKGMSYINPFDISGRTDFNGWYVVIGFLMSMYMFRGNTWQASFAASAKSAHEGKMATIISIWRTMAVTAMTGLVSLAALTLLHHPSFAAHADAVKAQIAHVQPAQLQRQVLMPTALGLVLPSGIKGALCAVLLMGFIAGMSAAIQSYSNTLVQDFVLPLRGRHFAPRQHLRLLRAVAIAIGVLGCVLSAAIRPVDYIVLLTSVMSAIYIAGTGCITLGGLYWRRATTQGAWTALAVGSGCAITFTVTQQFWTELHPWLLAHLPAGALLDWVRANPEKCPLHGQQLAAISFLLAGGGFVLVSLLTCRGPHDMDKLLHRGQWAVAGDEKKAEGAFRLGKLIGIDENCSRGDRAIILVTFWWTTFFSLLSIGILAWNLLAKRWADAQWWNYYYVLGVVIPLFVGTGTTVWFLVGGTRDLVRLARSLKDLKRDDTDDGLVERNSAH